MEPHDEIAELVKRLEAAAPSSENDAAFDEPVARLKQSAEAVARSASGSWLGYHANVYYAGLTRPPPGAHFSSEWGLKELFGDLGSRGDWQEFSQDCVQAYIVEQAGSPDLSIARSISKNASLMFEVIKDEALILFEHELLNSPDAFLGRLKKDLQRLCVATKGSIIQSVMPRGEIMTRDMTAMGQGFQTPPHMDVLADVIALQHNIQLPSKGAEILRKAGSYLERKHRRVRKSHLVGTNVFIGHGRSPLWRELKDFIDGRLALPWDEFNRVPVAGVTNIARLSEMLDAAAIAFLVMTGEDEMADGALQARMNVIHEAGLFQGRLGFSKAIVVLEEGCTEFSNIQGLGQIRFQKGRISAAFEEIRQVLEREGLLDSDSG